MGYDNFYIYLFDALSGKRIGPLEEIVDPLDTGAGSYGAKWSQDSSEVTIVYRVDRHAPLKAMTYQLANGRAIPSTGNSRCSFTSTDAFGWKTFAQTVEKFLLTERSFVEGSLVLSFNAPFGTGKTTFLEMLKNDLEDRRRDNQELPLPILLNAWEEDYCGSPSSFSNTWTEGGSRGRLPENPGKKNTERPKRGGQGHSVIFYYTIYTTQ